jgi:hypothetical protein
VAADAAVTTIEGVHMKSAIATILTTFCMAASVCAKDKYHEVVNAASDDEFAQVTASVRKEMEDGGRYEFDKPDERSTIDKSIAAMAALFNKKGSVANMTQNDKIALFDNQEKVNAILTKRDSDRVICQNVTPIGSHIPKTTCHTYGQEEEARRGTTHQMNAWQLGPCIATSAKDNGCGGGR